LNDYETNSDVWLVGHACLPSHPVHKNILASTLSIHSHVQIIHLSAIASLASLQIIHLSAIASLASLHDCWMTAMKCRSKSVKKTSFNLLQHFYVKQKAPWNVTQLSPIFFRTEKKALPKYKPNIILIALSISPFADDSFFVLRMENVNLKHYQIMLIRQRVRWLIYVILLRFMLDDVLCMSRSTPFHFFFFFFLLLIWHFDATLCH
jgi:hypothetical protein